MPEARLGLELPKEFTESMNNLQKGQAFADHAMRDFDENFNTVLTPDEEKAFQKWKEKNAPHDSGEDYDLRGAYKASLQPDKKSGHWADTFKKPNHPTFSNESRYAPYGKPGRWQGETYVPPTEEKK